MTYLHAMFVEILNIENFARETLIKEVSDDLTSFPIMAKLS
jgi:hypothetical protein